MATSTRETTTRAWIYDVRMAQFVLKIEKLSHIMGPRASQDLRSPSPIMAPGFAETVVLKIRKSDDFRELYENEPEMAAPRLETNIRYLRRHIWRACCYDHKRFSGFREIIEFVSRFSEVY